MTAPHKVINRELLRVWLGYSTIRGAVMWAERNSLEPLDHRGPRGEVYYLVADVFAAQDREDARRKTG